MAAAVWLEVRAVIIQRQVAGDTHLKIQFENTFRILKFQTNEKEEEREQNKEKEKGNEKESDYEISSDSVAFKQNLYQNLVNRLLNVNNCFALCR